MHKIYIKPYYSPYFANGKGGERKMRALFSSYMLIIVHFE
jgi:hypothetical protein